MRRTWGALVITAVAALALSGCLRENGTYVLQEDNTVDGTIVLATDEDYISSDPPESGFDAAGVASKFMHSTVTDLGEPGWVGDRITFTDEPIGTFLTATEDYEIAVSRVGTQYVVTGAPIDPAEADSKQTIEDEGGSMRLRVTFPGEVVEHNGTLNGRTVTWDMLNQDAAPYARGSAVPPEPTPEPVVTVVVTPSPEPSPEPSPSPSPTLTEAAAPASSSGDIPVWVWVVGAGLLVAVVGLGSYLIASRGRGAAPTAATPGGAGSAVAGETEPEGDDEPEGDEDEEATPPTKETPVVEKKPKPKKDD